MEYAADLVSLHELDGVGASRKGRDPIAFAEIVHTVARARKLEG